MPKDVDVIYYNEDGSPAEIKSYHFDDEEDIQGWYYFEDEPYLTKGALKKELKLKPKELERIITNKAVRTEEVTNEYRTFTVYNLSDALRAKVKLEGVLVDTKN